MAADAISEPNDTPISVPDGTDAVQGACQAHAIVCMERVFCTYNTRLFSCLAGHAVFSRFCKLRDPSEGASGELFRL